jgi:hypothetical protein
LQRGRSISSNCAHAIAHHLSRAHFHRHVDARAHLDAHRPHPYKSHRSANGHSLPDLDPNPNQYACSHEHAHRCANIGADAHALANAHALG